MEVRYDKEVDAAYIKLSSKRPEGAIEIDEGVILHVTEDDKIVAIEVLGASGKIPVKNLFNLRVDTYERKDRRKTK
jgi:Uncharacterized conserved small protein